MKVNDVMDILAVDEHKILFVDADGGFQDFWLFGDDGLSAFFGGVGDIESNNLLSRGVFRRNKVEESPIIGNVVERAVHIINRSGEVHFFCLGASP